MVKIGLVVFPGSNCDRDVFNVLNNILKLKTEYLWHKTDSIHEFDAVILPGGFSYGDRLRAGIIAARSPIVRQVKKLAEVIEVSGVYGVYDIVLKVRGDTMDKLRETITWHVRRIDKVRSTLTMIVIEGQGKKGEQPPE